MAMHKLHRENHSPLLLSSELFDADLVIFMSKESWSQQHTVLLSFTEP